MKNDFHSLSTDGSNDTGLEKMNPLTVRHYDSSKSRVDTRFLDMYVLLVRIQVRQPQSFKRFMML